MLSELRLCLRGAGRVWNLSAAVFRVRWAIRERQGIRGVLAVLWRAGRRLWRDRCGGDGSEVRRGDKPLPSLLRVQSRRRRMR